MSNVKVATLPGNLTADQLGEMLKKLSPEEFNNPAVKTLLAKFRGQFLKKDFSPSGVLSKENVRNLRNSLDFGPSPEVLQAARAQIAEKFKIVDQNGLSDELIHPWIKRYNKSRENLTDLSALSKAEGAVLDSVREKNLLSQITENDLRRQAIEKEDLERVLHQKWLDEPVPAENLPWKPEPAYKPSFFRRFLWRWKQAREEGRANSGNIPFNSPIPDTPSPVIDGVFAPDAQNAPILGLNNTKKLVIGLGAGAAGLTTGIMLKNYKQQKGSPLSDGPAAEHTGL